MKNYDLLKLRGEHVISVSNTFVHPDYSRIKPMYHVLPSLLQSHGHIHEREQLVTWLKQMEQSIGGAEIFLHFGDKALIEQSGLFNGIRIHWVEYSPWNGAFDVPIDLKRIPSIGSVSELALTLAIFLGYDNIYLLGIDHDWFNGLFVYFYDHATQHVMRPNQDTLSFADSEFQMRRHADIFRKYKYLRSLHPGIYNVNLNPNHYLDVFPKVDYASLFNKTT
ncbi:MAG: hypothetical protein PHV33_11760 [Elusimicrobiales bacterium]|nr:hypothetical protein [Elusimicrobiales bacterium]